MNKEGFGKKLKELRERAGDTQQQLGDLLKLNLKQIQRYEAGLVPTHEAIQFICDRYQYDFTSLIYDVPRGTNTEDFQRKYYEQVERNNLRLERQVADLTNAFNSHIPHENIQLIQAIAATNQDLLIELLAKQRKIPMGDLRVEVGKANGEKMEEMKQAYRTAGVHS